MRKLYVILVLILFFAGYAFSASRMEKILADGEDVLLPLAPVDPRALLMGDYMDLDYAVNDAIFTALREQLGAAGKRRPQGDRPYPGMPSSGYAVVRAEGVAVPKVVSFARLDDGTPLKEGEFRLFFRVRGAGVITAAPAFYFQEGHARFYERARFGRVKMAGNGKTLLVTLCDENGADIVTVPEKE